MSHLIYSLEYPFNKEGLPAAWIWVFKSLDDGKTHTLYQKTLFYLLSMNLDSGGAKAQAQRGSDTNLKLNNARQTYIDHITYIHEVLSQDR